MPQQFLDSGWEPNLFYGELLFQKETNTFAASSPSHFPPADNLVILGARKISETYSKIRFRSAFKPVECAACFEHNLGKFWGKRRQAELLLTFQISRETIHIDFLPRDGMNCSAS
jgi:hypothetical protein